MIIKILLLIVYALINIWHADLDAKAIKKGRRIYHGFNAIGHIILVAFTCHLLNNWVFGISMLALRRIVFDTALNKFRGLRFDYISSSTTSIIDRISYKFQQKFGYIPYYGIFFLIVIICILIKT